MLRALIAVLPLAACATYIEDRTSEEFVPVYDEAATFLPPPVTGGIYSDGARGLFASDIRAAGVGDVLTVQFTERFAATKSQTASGARSSNYEIDLPDVLTGGFDDARLSNSTDQSFTGRGGAAQSNSFTGRLTVTVVRVLPNGHLEVMGQKRITLNNGNEYVRLTGTVRPEDIGPDNVVLSDRLANADIRYVGAGDTADTARPGWLRRGLTTVSPL
jgi:flagellar L-ring protein precursor FlgH